MKHIDEKVLLAQLDKMSKDPIYKQNLGYMTAVNHIMKFLINLNKK